MIRISLGVSLNENVLSELKIIFFKANKNNKKSSINYKKNETILQKLPQICSSSILVNETIYYKD